MKCFMSWDTLACFARPPILTRLLGSKNGCKWKSHLALFNSSLVVLVSNLLISSLKASSCMCLMISCSAAFSSFSHLCWVILACSRSCQSINRCWRDCCIASCLVQKWLVINYQLICCNIYLSGFVKTWLKKFQVHFNYLTSKWNRKQWKVTGWR